jgi:hypothetical protein
MRTVSRSVPKITSATPSPFSPPQESVAAPRCRDPEIPAAVVHTAAHQHGDLWTTALGTAMRRGELLGDLLA